MKTFSTTHSFALAALLVTGLSGCNGSEGSPGDPPDDGITVSDAGTDAEEFDMTSGCDDLDLPTPPSGTVEDPRGVFEVTAEQGPDCGRRYRMTSTAPRRDGEPENPRVVDEVTGWPTLRTGNVAVDALYAMTMEEVRQNSVDAISDGSFNDGEPIPCADGGCFETGEKWKYVWTRDISYALHLGLAGLDPQRAKNSLLFKLSTRRDGTDEQVMQDTGTGGSYPVSTDRVVWALGAEAVLAQLGGADADEFANRALDALGNTLRHDRAVVWDEASGLYRGEQSFLDWREQTYPRWVEGDPVHIAMSKSLSTNLLHFAAMDFVRRTAPLVGREAEFADIEEWRVQLAEVLVDRFWVPEDNLMSAFFVTGLSESPSRQYDLLGNSLAVSLGAIPPGSESAHLLSFPHLGYGAPVIAPQQQFTPIYHNRAEWPFVSAYWLRAASKDRRNSFIADRMSRSLLHGAAMNLSNMENLEVVTGLPWVEDGDYSGPVVNSRRQLWSVAAFVSMVHQSWFGLIPYVDRGQNLRLEPRLPRQIRNELFPDADELVLSGYRFQGKTLDVVLELPDDPDGGAGFYRVAFADTSGDAMYSVTLDGDLVELPLQRDDFEDGAELRVKLALPNAATGAPPKVVDDADWRRVFAPQPPSLSISEQGGALTLALATDDDPASVRWNIYRDGQRVASDLQGPLAGWEDPDWDATSDATPCYAAETCFDSGNCSQRSQPQCWWGPNGERIQTIGADQLENTGGMLTDQYGRTHWSVWGDAGHSLTARNVSVAASGNHLLQVEYGNGAGGVTTGITCGVKYVKVTDETSGAVVGEGYLVMPHLGSWERWSYSSFVPVTLNADRTYTIEILSDDERAVNMSAFEHFASYTGGEGGAEPFNRVNIAELRLLKRE